MDAVQRGGTLRCNADCTFDVTECTLASCGNGVAEEGEACDGADLGAGSCSSIGYGGGDIACTSDCAYDVSACCTDTCPTADKAECVGNTLRACTAGPSGCLAWQITDCGANNNICEGDGATATCSCVDSCSSVGDTRCEGAMIETCMDVGGCLDWQQTVSCGAGHVCAEALSGPTCALDISAEDCTDPYPLAAGENVVAWTALNADYLTSEPSCTENTPEGPDLVLSYTAAEKGYLGLTLEAPLSTGPVIVASTGACGTPMPVVACTSDVSSVNSSSQLPVDMGVTYYFYVRDTDSGSEPLPNPLSFTVEEAPCSSLSSQVSSLTPADGWSIPDETPLLVVNFDYAVDTSAGVINVTGDKGTNISYDLAMSPPGITLLDQGKTLMIDPGVVFPADEIVTVTWTGLADAVCGKPFIAPTWTFGFGPTNYAAAPASTLYDDACVGGTVQTLDGSVDEGRTSPIEVPPGFVFFGAAVPHVKASTNGWLTLDTTVTASDFSNNMMPDQATPNGLIAPYWDDLDDMVICTKIVNGALVVQWNGDLYSSNSTVVQFQTILDPSDDSIQFVYGPSHQPDGSSATVGIEDPTGTYGLQLEYNTSGTVTANSSVKVTRN